jgi:hypothetical protein
MDRLDPGKYRLGRTREDYDAAMHELSSKINADDFEFSPFSKSLRGGKPVFTASTCTDEFALRKLNDNVRRLYNVAPANRYEIVAQVKLLLNDRMPFFVLRFDVKNFYESINRSQLIDSLCARSILGYRSKQILKKLFNGTNLHVPGLPRGISLSSTLSEIYMKDFDDMVRRLPGVYYYARYVDDIVIFSITPSENIKSLVIAALPPQMLLNEAKEEQVEFNENGNCVKFKREPNIEYLGYRFHFRQQKECITAKGAPQPPPKLVVKIAKAKLEKLKRRTVLAILDHCYKPDYPLLLARFKFLTGNCELHRHKHDGKLLSGIYYNYSYIDVAAHDDLAALTAFMRKAIFSKSGAFGAKLNSNLTREQRATIGKLCFKSGYCNRITHSFSAKRLRVIKKCWHHV